MSQYNKTVLTSAGLELAKRANAGQAKFEITRAVTSADDWSNKTIQDIEAVTAIPNIMQQGTIRDTEEVESNNSVMGVSLCFTNKNLSASYQIKIIGVYVKEEGQENDFLYAVTTAVSPEYMPDFNDKVLYRFNIQMYLVIGKAQAVNVVINDGASVTHGQFDKYKSEVTADLEKIENAHKEDMSHVVKSASINGGAEVLPDEAGKLELVVPDPDLSKYVSLEQLTETLKTKADITAIPDKTATEEGIKQAKELAQEADTKAQNAMESKADKTNVYTKLEVDGKTSGTIITGYDVASKTAAKETNAYSNRELVDQAVLGQFADAINDINGTWNRYTHNDGFDLLTLWGQYGIHYCLNSNMTNVPDWFTDKRGTAFVFKFDNNSQTIIYAGCVSDGFAYYNKLEGKWHKLATDNDIPLAFKGLLTSTDDMNKVLESGMYITQGAAPQNFPPSDKNRGLWGTILVYNHDAGQILQLWLVQGNVFHRWIMNSAPQTEWQRYADQSDITDLQNQIQQLKDNQFEVQTFTDATAAANWEAQRPGKRMAIVNS